MPYAPEGATRIKIEEDGEWDNRVGFMVRLAPQSTGPRVQNRIYASRNKETRNRFTVMDVAVNMGRNNDWRMHFIIKNFDKFSASKLKDLSEYSQIIM
jgi:hypothetical protein